MKPDWKDAPEWAKWLAMDSDGEWHWYSHKPEPNTTSECWLNPDAADGEPPRCQYAGRKTNEWVEMLEPRP